MSIRFSETEVRGTGRSSMGVKSINLKKNDNVVSMNTIDDETIEDRTLLVISEKGYGKRTTLDEYRSQSRGGTGIKTYNIKPHTGKIIGAKIVDEDDEVMIISVSGIIIRLGVKAVSLMGRSTQGVRLMRLGDDDRVVSIARVVSEDDEENKVKTKSDTELENELEEEIEEIEE